MQRLSLAAARRTGTMGEEFFNRGAETMRSIIVVLAGLMGSLWASAAEAPCVSGPKVGQRPGPYSFVMCTGEQRGKAHCFICETLDRPAVIVFARSLSD